MFNFIHSTPQPCDKNKLLDELTTTIKIQADSGNINLDELKKIVALVKNTAKLKNALRFL